MTHEESQKMFDEVKANISLLHSCSKHRFAESPTKHTFGERVECERCHGRMGVLDALHYTRGYRAAGGDPADVMPQWHLFGMH